MPTNIEWCEETWNPVVGCSKVSEGCKNCYALRFAWRLAQNPEVDLERYQETVINIGVDKKHPWPEWTGRIAYFPERLEQPLHWRKPRRVFIASMGDLFHPAVDPLFQDKIFRTMAMPEAANHTFLFLTKRPDEAYKTYCLFESDWPSQVWMGVTAENQEQADKRIPVLLQIPAAKRFVSIEPMLSEVDIWNELIGVYGPHCERDCDSWERDCPGYNCEDWLHGLDLVICGGETGPGARPMHPAWVRSLRDQCQAAWVPFFFKGWGDWVASTQTETNWPRPMKSHTFEDGEMVFRFGKKAAGRLLDGREWNGWPE